MAGGFTNPSILFLSTWDSPERAVCKEIFHHLAHSGKYTRYVELCSGALAMPLVALNAGYTPEQMVASDVSLFSSIVGTMLDDGEFDRLQVKVDGEPVIIKGDTREEQAAYLLWLQLLMRMKAKPEVPYWLSMIEDLEKGQARHIEALANQLHNFSDRLGGLNYRPRCMFEHLAEVAEDPHTVVSINPPTYKAGFENFFNTKGRLTWATPDYEIFDPDSGNHRLVDFMRDKPALLVAQQQKEPGDCSHEEPFFARHLSLGQYVYLHSNRPKEIKEILGGMRVMPQRESKGNEPLDIPVIPSDYVIRKDSEVMVFPVKTSVAEWYRGMWMHRLTNAGGGMNLLITVDGMAAGVIGYSMDTMLHSYSDKWNTQAVLRFAFGAPHDVLRLTRLATMIALRKESLELLGSDKSSMHIAACEGLVTVEMTRHPEAKGLRGLMKLQDRQKHPDGWKLVYQADWSGQNLEETVSSFLEKEEKWRKARN